VSKWKGLIAAIALVLTLAAATDPSPGYPAYERANALFVDKKFPESLAAVEEALRLDPKLVPALTLKAKMAMAANQFDTARQSLEQALAVNPRAAYAQFLYGLQAYMTNDMKEALPRLRKARQLNPSDPHAALYLGLTSESLGQTSEAMSLYEEAVRLARSAGDLGAETLLPGAKLLLLIGRLEDCDRWLREALKLSPNSRDAHFEYARLLLKKGDAANAAAQGETALTMADGVISDTAIHYLLVRAWQANGMPDRAQVHADIIHAQEASPQHF
jgi:tetratricopeptide (TPR) repeat protein